MQKQDGNYKKKELLEERRNERRQKGLKPPYWLKKLKRKKGRELKTKIRNE